MLYADPYIEDTLDNYKELRVLNNNPIYKTQGERFCDFFRKGARDGFTVHGGWFSGSAGCIDLGDGMDTFDDWVKINGKDLVIKVRYTDE